MSVESISGYADIWSSAMQSLREQQDQETSEGGSFEDLASQLIEGSDSDGDGALSIGETQLSDEEFSNLDTDADGALSAAEVASGLSTNAEDLTALANPATQIAQSILSSLDSDGDGSLSLDESGLDEDLFDSLDSDGDGLLSSDEVAASIQAPSDDSGSGLSMGGVSAGGGSSDDDDDDDSSSSSILSDADTNGDGVVSEAELLEWLGLDDDEDSLFSALTNAEGTGGDETSETASTTDTDADSLTESLIAQALQAYQDQMDDILDQMFGNSTGMAADTGGTDTASLNMAV